jgi:hypothetical protein
MFTGCRETNKEMQHTKAIELWDEQRCRYGRRSSPIEADKEKLTGINRNNFTGLSPGTSPIQKKPTSAGPI